MNIVTLNHWAENLLGFAWPMLWQSSLIIVVVFALDFLLARRVRAAIRHALWIVVLVKLLLPPALALPTGATWWLWPAKPALTPVIKTQTVTYDSTPPPDNFVHETVPMPVPPPPKLSGVGWLMLASGIVSIGLLLSLGVNWLKVERKSRQALSSNNFTADLDDAQRLAGLRAPMRLKLVDDAISPAVYGLFRPVILLPRALAEKLSATQLRAVLLHEAMHLRRGDVWVNCAQTLLQIAYWWHPLLWLANARIRRLREEAVDDAVMLALRGDADAYAPTLLEVAKFAFRRPLASLGLVGILESRSALRQRVERLVDFRPPPRAGVTFLSLFGIFLFGAVTLPMGQAPAAMTVAGSAGLQWQASPPPSSRTIGQPLWEASSPSHPTQVFIVGHFFWMLSSDVGALTAGLPHNHGYAGGASDWITATNAKTLAEINQRIHSLGVKPSSAPRIVTISGNAASIYVGNRTNWYKFNCTPVVAGDQINLAFKTEVASVSPSDETNHIEISGQAMVGDGGGVIVRAENPNDSSSNLVLVISAKIIDSASAPLPTDTMLKLSCIHMGVSYQNATLGDVLMDVTKRARQLDPDGEGVAFMYSGSIPGKAEAPGATAIHINLTLNDAYLGQVLDGIRLSADYPVEYSVQDGVVVFAPRGADLPVNRMRILRVDLDKFPWYVKDGLLSSSSTVPDPQTGGSSVIPLGANPLLKKFFQDQGVNFDSSEIIFYDPPEGSLHVYATPKTLDAIERVVLAMNTGTFESATGSPKDNTNVAGPAPLPYTSPAQNAIYHKLKQIRLPAVSFQNLPLSEVIRTLHEQSQLRDPDKAGINFSCAPPNPGARTVYPATGLPEATPPVSSTVNPADIQINLTVKYASLEKILEAICASADRPIKYSVEDYGVVFRNKDTNTVKYEMRTFKINTNTFLASLQQKMPSYYNYPPNSGGLLWAQPVRGTNDIGDLTRQYFRKQGLNLDPPKTIFYNDRLGVLFVYATPEDLKVIEDNIMELNDPRTPFRNVTRSSSRIEREKAADAWERVGKGFYEEGNLDEARQDLRQALDLDPDNQQARYYLDLISQAKVALQSRQDSAHASHVPFVLAKPPANTSTVPLVTVDPLHLLVSASVNPSDLVTNYFYDVSMPAFEAAVRKETGESDVILGFREIAAKAGVDLSPPKQVSITNYRSFEGLCVVAAGKDLRTIGVILDDLHCVLPQIHIKARFIEVPKTYFDDEKNSTPTAVTNGGILTDSQFRKFLHQLQSQKGPQEIAEPEVTTIEGRQTQMRATVIQPIVTSFALGSSTSHNAPTDPQLNRIESSGGHFYTQHDNEPARRDTIDPQTQPVETGPILDVMATYLPDSYTIDLKTIPSIIKFYGYADTQGLPKQFETNSDGRKIEVPISIPVFAVGEVTDEARIYDGQTLVLLPNPKAEFNGGVDEKYRDRIIKHIQEAQKKEGNKQLIVLVTATFIDAGGNRIHSDAGMAFAKNRVPQQPVIWDSIPVP
jgi:beta-lactamase regulating signal transducer with metallopeptidase domain